MLSLTLALLYPLAVRYKQNKWWLLVTMPALLLDVVANYTELAILTLDFPRRGEFTFSTRLIRLQEGTRWQRYVASKVIPYLNRYDPLS